MRPSLQRADPVRGQVLKAGIRRLAVIFAAILALTIGGSAAIGLITGADLRRSIAIGLYSVGALFLGGCFLTGVRGPLRGISRTGETVPLFGARGVRRASTDERSEASRTTVLLFAIGLVLIVLGSAFDSAHRSF